MMKRLLILWKVNFRINGKDKCDLAVSYFLCLSYFLYPLKYKKTRGFLFYFQGVWKEASGLKKVKKIKVSPLSANPSKLSNTLKQFVGNSEL